MSHKAGMDALTLKELTLLRTKVEELEKRLSGVSPTEVKKIASSSSDPVTSSETTEPSRPSSLRISSLPIDTASRVIYGGKEYVISQREDKVCIERAEVVDERSKPFIFRKKPLVYPERTTGPSWLLHNAAAYITGWSDWEY